MAPNADTAAAAAATYKQLKEDFVSNLTGGTPTEINLVTLVAPVSVLVWSILQARGSFFTPYSPMGFAVDFLLNASATLLATTVHASDPAQFNLILLAAGVASYFLNGDTAKPNRKKVAKPPHPPAAASSPKDARPPAAASSPKDARPPATAQWSVPVKAFVTTYRGTMMVVTCAAILAVDFPIFPRRFAKVETWGTSLMDMGVGSFVFSAGLVGARPMLKERLEGGPRGPSSVVGRVANSMRHSLPLLVLGIIRLLSVKGLDYAEHVSEYGVHWNFFFTLACLPPFVAAFQPALQLLPSLPLLSTPGLLAMILAGGYQLVLENTALKAFILTAPRVDLFSKNREGIFSIVGYLAIFLAGQDAGVWALPRPQLPDSKSANKYRLTLVRDLGIKAAIWLGLYLLATDLGYGFNLTVSRRLSNLPYVLWVAAFNVSQVLAFAAIDVLFFPPAFGASAADARAENERHDRATSRVLRGFNRNGLAVFLLANLLTGLVNLTVPTLHVGVPASMGILAGYMAVVSAVAVLLDHFDISIKL